MTTKTDIEDAINNLRVISAEIGKMKLPEEYEDCLDSASGCIQDAVEELEAIEQALS